MSTIQVVEGTELPPAYVAHRKGHGSVKLWVVFAAAVDRGLGSQRDSLRIWSPE